MLVPDLYEPECLDPRLRMNPKGTLVAVLACVVVLELADSRDSWIERTELVGSWPEIHPLRFGVVDLHSCSGI